MLMFLRATPKKAVSLFVLLTFFLSLVFQVYSALPVSAVRDIVFPIIGGATYSNDFNSPRSNGTHGATDMFAPKMRQIVSPVNGIVTFVPSPQPSYGYMISIRDSDDYRYNFIHINNDTPGTDDGKGKEVNAYAPDMQPGNPVVRGQHIAYVGDSGNAETTASHLHFEIIKPNGDPENPFPSLNEATRKSKPVVYPALPGEILPYGGNFKGEVSLAMGNLDVDQASEQVTTPGAGGGPYVKTFDSNNASLGGFFAYDAELRCGLDVAMGDVDNDGVDEIITGPKKGCGPHVKVFEANGTPLGAFFAYDPKLRDGIRVSSGDVDGDGTDEIITVPGKGSGPQVKAFELNGTITQSFFAFDSKYRDGVDIASGDIQGDTTEEIVASPGPGGGPHIKIFEDGVLIKGFTAYDSTFRGGVNVAVGNVRESTPLEEIVTIPNVAGGPQIKLFSGTGSLLQSGWLLERWWRGPYDIAAGYDVAKGSGGLTRRGTVRPGID